MATLADIDHDAGNLDEWDDVYANGVTMEATTASALKTSTYGMELTTDADSDSAYARADITVSTNTLQMSIYLDPNSLTMGSGDVFVFARLYDASGSNDFFEFSLRYDGTNHELMVTGYNDAGSGTDSSQVDVTDAAHWTEVIITRATGSAANDGQVDWYIDGSLEETVTSTLDNYDVFPLVDCVEIGAISGLDATTIGTFYLDEVMVEDTGTPTEPPTGIAILVFEGGVMHVEGAKVVVGQ